MQQIIFYALLLGLEESCWV